MFKGKNPSAPKNFNFSSNKKRIQCRDYEGFGHIQSECANTQKRKNKALKSTWSDKESKGSHEEADLLSIQVAFSSTLVSDNCLFMQGCAGVSVETVYLYVKSGSIALENKSATNNECGSKSDCRDESEKANESLHEVYKKMYEQWLMVCSSNRALNCEIQVLHNLNVKAEGEIPELELLFT